TLVSLTKSCSSDVDPDTCSNHYESQVATTSAIDDLTLTNSPVIIYGPPKTAFLNQFALEAKDNADKILPWTGSLGKDFSLEP
ncbi:hypothetical protein ABTN24_20020, partial [Acinetobacter baumannii]